VSASPWSCLRHLLWPPSPPRPPPRRCSRRRPTSRSATAPLGDQRGLDSDGNPDLATARWLSGTDLLGSVGADRVQRQHGRKVVVKVKAKANEDLEAKASGEVKVKKNSYKLTSQTKSVASGENKTLKLKPKRLKDTKKIVKYLKRGKAATAKLKVKLSDRAGNKKATRLSVKLKGTGGAPGPGASKPYVALGDSIAAGAAAAPGEGYVDLLYSDYATNLGADELLNRSQGGANSHQPDRLPARHRPRRHRWPLRHPGSDDRHRRQRLPARRLRGRLGRSVPLSVSGQPGNRPGRARAGARHRSG